MPVAYPPTRLDDTVDVLHGVSVPDPYRWLEDPTSEETCAWVDAQNALTFAFLNEIPARAALRSRLVELWNYARRGAPSRHGDRWFFFKNDGLENQNVLCVADSAEAPGRVLLDPNRLSPDGTIALTGMAASEDGKLVAYGLSHSGSDWQDWHVRDVATGADLPDHLRWVRFSGASFTRDGKGFFYSRYPEPPPGAAHTAQAYHQRLCYHRLGTPQSEDVLVYERPDQKEWGFGGAVSDDGRYLFIAVWHGTDPKNRVFYRDLAGDGPVVELLPDADAMYRVIGNDGARFLVHTNLDAPKGRIVEIDLAAPDRASWRELVAEAPETLLGASYVGGRLLASYLRDAASVVRVFARDGRLAGEVPLPGVGTVAGFDGRFDDEETFFTYTDHVTPARVYRYRIAENRVELVWQPELRFDPEAYESRQVFYKSADGTRVPLSIIHKKGLDPTATPGGHATYLYGYGGFNISLTPVFDVSRLVWMEQGGVLAVANLRGGGEYGEAWHLAGCKAKKQNVFDDFIAAAEYLVGNGITSPRKLAIGGASNGGLLVGACLTQRPELFAAALPDVGVLDMLRFHKFTIGWAWTSDYGDPDDADDFRTIYKYSPLHAIRPGTRYPATLITTADTDDRVVSAHSYKFAAALQAAQAGAAPVLLRVDVRAGHGAGKPTSKLIESITDRWAFLIRVLGMLGMQG